MKRREDKRNEREDGKKKVQQDLMPSALNRRSGQLDICGKEVLFAVSVGGVGELVQGHLFTLNVDNNRA